MNTDTITQEVLGLDLDNLTQAQIDWLHTLKNNAFKMMLLKQARLEGYTGEVQS